MAAAVYASSEGVKTLVIEGHAVGGQAGTSSLIRNYLGFPRGLPGGDLAFRAFEQNMMFGTEFVLMQRAAKLEARDGEGRLTLGDGSEVAARAIVLAAGVQYRRLGVPSLEALTGMGVFYGAAGVEAPGMAGKQVYVVGGGDSSGQASLHLAKYANTVTILVRGKQLEGGMSDYLIQQIGATPNVQVRTGVQVVDGRGDERLEAITIEAMDSKERTELHADGLFVMIGAEPRTEWLPDSIAREERGYILTGSDIPAENWTLAQPPLPFETSLPGVFAVGDIRQGSVKRVAGAVGEGSVAIGSVRRYLTEAGTGAAARATV